MLSIQQRTPKQSQVDIEFAALVVFEGPSDFWQRAQMIASAVYSIQSFSTRAWPKGVWVIPRRSRSEADPVALEGAVEDPPDD